MMAWEGYHLVHWSAGDFTYWAVSDVNINDLQSFKQLFEQQTAVINKATSQSRGRRLQ
jgi:anti-sigma factor RsiW